MFEFNCDGFEQIFYSCLPTSSQCLPTVFCFSRLCLTCTRNLFRVIIGWVWFDMYWKHQYVRKLLHMWTSQPLHRWTPSSFEGRAANSCRVFVSPRLWGSFLVVYPICTCDDFCFIWKIEQCTLWCHGRGKSIEPMRSCSHTCKCAWALNVTDCQ